MAYGGVLSSMKWPGAEVGLGRGVDGDPPLPCQHRSMSPWQVSSEVVGGGVLSRGVIVDDGALLFVIS